MKVLRPLLILTLIEIILCGVLVIELSNLSEFATTQILPSAVQMLAFFVGILCIILFIDGILYMRGMNKALNKSIQPQPIYHHDPMLDALDVIDQYGGTVTPARYIVTPTNQNDAAA